MTTISVIIPFYKSKSTLHRCLDSVLAQTYRDFEVLCVSDGSDDGSTEIVREYIKKDPRVQLLEKEHEGVSAARNCGILAAKGTYIQFIDSDDDIEPDMFAAMLGLANAENADLVICNYTHPSLRNYLGNCRLDLSRPEDAFRYYQDCFAGHIPWNKLWRRSAITDLFEVGVDFCEDGLFNLANMRNVRTAVSTDKILYHYYVAPPSAFEELSCINKIAQENAFWETKNTYWYQLDRLLPNIKAILEKHFEKEWQGEFLYVRSFDFMLWELVILSMIGVDREGLIVEMQNIFSEPSFLKSMQRKEKYGVLYRNEAEKKRDACVEAFVRSCYAALDTITSKKLPLDPYTVFLYLFVSHFVTLSKKVNAMEAVAKAALRLKAGETPEAKYVHELLFSAPVENTPVAEDAYICERKPCLA